MDFKVVFNSFFPERHPQVRQRPGIRRFIVGKYFKVFYRVQRGGVGVSEVYERWLKRDHGTMDHGLRTKGERLLTTDN